MLKFVTKKEYWAAEAAGILDLMPGSEKWYLKTVQDVIALSHLHHLEGMRIAEIGGGDSRVLRVLKEHNYCVNIDEFKGEAKGPTDKMQIDGIENIYVKVGEFCPRLADESFNVVFSISVIEHIPTPELDDFFQDSIRILKPGGQLIHLIDMYLEDDEHGNRDEMTRISLYNRLFEMDAVESVGDRTSPVDLRFSCTYATNPDSTMNEWNRLVPGYAEKRERAQCCTLLMMATKKKAG